MTLSYLLSYPTITGGFNCTYVKRVIVGDIRLLPKHHEISQVVVNSVNELVKVLKLSCVRNAFVSILEKLVGNLGNMKRVWLCVLCVLCGFLSSTFSLRRGL